MEKVKTTAVFLRLKGEKSFCGESLITKEITSLCQTYSDGGADALVLLDESENEKEHKQVIECLKAIAKKPVASIISGGFISHIDDIKKYLYAGCELVLFKADTDKELIKEGISRFSNKRCALYLTQLSQLSIAKECAVTKVYLYAEVKREEILQAMVDYPELELHLFAKGEWKEEAKLLQAGAKGIFFNQPQDMAGNLMEIKQQLKEWVEVEVLQASVGWSELKLNNDGMIPVVVQDYLTEEVLMVAYMNEEAYNHTISSGKMTYYSRSRNELWIKGETSGHYQYVKSLKIDCDKDTILARVAQVGAACHTGNKTCFYTDIANREEEKVSPYKVLDRDYQVIHHRKNNPKEGSYTNYLYEKGLDKILKKVGEEATEIVIAAKNEKAEEVTYEIADFLYHLMVLMADKEITWEDVARELVNRSN